MADRQKEFQLQKSFLAVARKACTEYSLIVQPMKQPCPDMCFGPLSRLDREEARKVEDGIDADEGHRILLILESPHVREYSDKKKIQPIKGHTGTNVFSFLPKILGNSYSEWYLYVINAVRYQCSQGLRLRDGMNADAKNFVVGNLLNFSTFQDDLRQRVKGLFRKKQDIIINACTASKAYNLELDNKSMVEKVISTLIKNSIESYRTLPHPASWKKKRLSALREQFKSGINSDG